MIWDVFISHASEDKASVARPIYRELVERGYSVWFDEATLLLGDSLRKKIDEGLSKCRFGVVIISPHFLSKSWPVRELDALVVREDQKDKVILPVWHEVTLEEVLEFSPILAGKLAVSTIEGIDSIVSKISLVLEHSATAEDSKDHNSINSKNEKTITDETTDLMWTRKDNGICVNWIEANDYAENLRLGGYDDWRLPTISELQLLIRDRPDIADSFDTDRFFPVWSSTSVSSKHGAYRIHLSDFTSKDWSNKEGMIGCLVLCVRNL